ncbi:MAG: heme exporter protein CcmB [Deferribacteres bacterium]|nr:heme exporter protein CcmB [candidate division KSB1 bacterium]MCB9510166.1 heme exporter protein CcmB [Deferribacteres bacterium]
MSYFQKIFAITYKDVIFEFRSRESVSSMLMFSLLVVVIFSFTFDPGSTYVFEAAPGIIWVAITFSGIIGLNRSFFYEVDKGSMHGMLLTPVDRGVIYFGKVLSNLIFMLIVEIFTLPLFMILFNLDLYSHLAELVSVTLLATIGFAAVGTLFSAMAVNTKTRDVMLPILLFPVFVPVILAAVNATGSILAGESWATIGDWLKLLAVFDVIFLALCYLLFEYVVEE